MPKCINCDTVNDEGTKFCKECGTKFEQEVDFGSDDQFDEESSDELIGKASKDINETKENIIQEEIHENGKNHSHSKSKFIITSIIILLIIASSLFYWKYYNDKNYSKELKEAASTMNFQSFVADQMAFGYVSHWRAAIKFNSDFNEWIEDKRQEFLKDGSIETLSMTKDYVSKKLKKLNNPPNKFKDAYETAVEMFGYYDEFTSLAIQPSGSLQSYSQKTTNLYSEISKIYKQFEVRMPN